MSEEGSSIDDGLFGLLADSEVSSLMRRMTDMKLPVSQEEIQGYYAAFHEFDRDESGNISTSELGQVMRSLGENPTGMELETIINEYDEDGSGRIEFPEFLTMMARKAREEQEKEHLHWQEVFRVFTMPSILPGTTQATNRDGQKVTVFPKTLEQAGFDKEPKITERELPIDEFRFVMSSLNISGRRIVSMEEVDEMINAVDDGDGRLDFQEFTKLLTK